MWICQGRTLGDYRLAHDTLSNALLFKFAEQDSIFAEQDHIFAEQESDFAEQGSIFAEQGLFMKKKVVSLQNLF